MQKRKSESGKWKKVIQKSNKKVVALTIAGAIMGTNIAPITVSAWTARTPEQISADLENIQSVSDLGNYNIQYGDTLWGISQATGFSVLDIANKHGIDNPSYIVAGRTLSGTPSRINQSKEVADYYTVTYGDTLSAIAQVFGTTVDQLAIWNDIENIDLIFPGERFLVRQLAEASTQDKSTEESKTKQPSVSNTSIKEVENKANKEDSKDEKSQVEKEEAPKEEQTKPKPEKPAEPQPEVPVDPQPEVPTEPQPEEPVEENPIIDVQKVNEEEFISHNIIRLEDETLELGEEIVEQKGSNGIIIKSYEISTHKDGTVKRELISEVVTVDPVDTIIRVGTKVADTEEETVNEIVDVSVRSETESIPHGVIRVEKDDLPLGEEVIVVDGKDGMSTTNYTVYTYADGTVVEEEESYHVSEAIDTVIHVGTQEENEDEVDESVREEVIDTKESSIPFKTIERETDALAIGETVVFREGQDGKQVETFKNMFVNGELVETLRINVEVTQPIARIILVGTKEPVVPEEPETPEVVEINRYEEHTQSEIPYEIEYIEDDTILEGEVIVDQEGKPGKRTRYYEVVEYSDGTVEETFLREDIVEPVLRIERVGTKTEKPETPGYENEYQALFAESIWDYEDFTYSNGSVSGFSQVGIEKANRNLGAGLVLPDKDLNGNVITGVSSQAFMGVVMDSLEMPNTITYIGTQSFRDTNVEHVTLSNGLLEIGPEAFYGASFHELNLPNSLRIIGNRAFMMTPIFNLEITPSVHTIGSEAFKWTNITEVYVPMTVKDLAPDSFDSYVELKGNVPGYEEPEEVTIVEGYIGNSEQQFDFIWDALDYGNSILESSTKYDDFKLIYIVESNGVSSYSLDFYTNEQVAKGDIDERIPGNVRSIVEQVPEWKEHTTVYYNAEDNTYGLSFAITEDLYHDYGVNITGDAFKLQSDVAGLFLDIIQSSESDYVLNYYDYHNVTEGTIGFHIGFELK